VINEYNRPKCAIPEQPRAALTESVAREAGFSHSQQCQKLCNRKAVEFCAGSVRRRPTARREPLGIGDAARAAAAALLGLDLEAVLRTEAAAAAAALGAGGRGGRGARAGAGSRRVASGHVPSNADSRRRGAQAHGDDGGTLLATRTMQPGPDWRREHIPCLEPLIL
jgi:hypothetical protein